MSSDLFSVQKMCRVGWSIHTYDICSHNTGQTASNVFTHPGILCEIAAPRELLREPSALPTHRDSCRIFSTTRGRFYQKIRKISVWHPRGPDFRFSRPKKKIFFRPNFFFRHVEKSVIQYPGGVWNLVTSTWRLRVTTRDYDTMRFFAKKSIFFENLTLFSPAEKPRVNRLKVTKND